MLYSLYFAFMKPQAVKCCKYYGCPRAYSQVRDILASMQAHGCLIYTYAGHELNFGRRTYSSLQQFRPAWF